MRVASGNIQCGSGADAGGASRDVFGVQNNDVKLTSSAVSYDGIGEIFQFDVTVQNLTPEAIGTPNGVFADPNGIRVFFNSGPTVTSGTGTITVENPDGTATFTAAGQPYYQYNQVLPESTTTAPKTWRLSVPPTVVEFTFFVLLSTSVQPLIVINEVFVNPRMAIAESAGEWFEVYNAGARPVLMQNYLLADSAASGRRPYYTITDSIVIQPGAYLVFGQTTNTTANGGATVDHAYGLVLALANSLDAVKISRIFGIDTLTIDEVKYSLPGISAQDGLSRELKNPRLPNINMDGGNWADPTAAPDYGPAGKGTPKAQNFNFTP